MDELSDYPLEHLDTGPVRAAPPPRSIGMKVAAVLLVAAAAVVAYIAFGMRFDSTTRPAGAPSSARDRALPPRALGGESDISRLPPLGETDALVRRLVQALSQNPAVAAWLSTDGLVRNFTVVVVNVAEGATPAKHLPTLRPPTAFHVVERDGGAYVDAGSYRRYAGVTGAVASIDPDGAARIYTMLKPRIEEAYRELGFPDQSFDRAFERAIVSLLSVPIVDGPIRVTPKAKGIGYAYVDERLEGLTNAQKQLLRVGPQNLRIIQQKLRAIALALGMRKDSLPGG